MALSDQNVFVGVSLANKRFSLEEVRKTLDAARETFSARKIAFLIADEIDMINQRVFETGSNKSLLLKVETRCAALEQIIWAEVPDEHRTTGRIVVKRWSSILNSEYFKSMFLLNELFLKNSEFRDDVFHLALLYAERRGRALNSAQTYYLCQYIIQELPTFINGVVIEKKRYLSMIYPAITDETVDTIVDGLFCGKYGVDFSRSRRCTITKV